MTASSSPFAPLDFPQDPGARRAIAAWLFACCALVFAIIVVGGLTRLTHSGLSIVEWQPIVGAVPPLDEARWEEAFAKYRASPEFLQRNFDMTLAGFKRIFWWEFVHRLLGRLIGIAFLLPFLYFLAKGRLRGALAWKLAAIFALGGVQGALGWYMVKSGLVGDPRVSQFRLAAHLGLAFLIYGAMLWIALGLAKPSPNAAPRGLRGLSTLVVALVFLMVLTGALVAGIRAGSAYNTFPLMNGHWIPPEMWMIDPWWKNFGYNMATVQFDHRIVAWMLIFLVPVLWWLVRRSAALDRHARAWSHALLALFALQVALGIATLLLRVPLPIAALHQAGAVLVFTSAIALRRSL